MINDVENLRVGDSGYLVADYLHGGCNKFAIILSELTGMKVGALFIEDPELEAEGVWCLTHAFCMIDDVTVVDAAGVRTLDEVKDSYGFDDRFDEFSPNCTELIASETLLGNYSQFAPGEKECIASFITAHILDDMAIYQNTERN